MIGLLPSAPPWRAKPGLSRMHASPLTEPRTPASPLDLSPAAYLVGLVALLGLALFVSIVNFSYAYDDALITYRIAWNFASGSGFVYNAGEWHLGTTAPLYGLLLGVLGWIAGPDRIPLFGASISCVSLALGGLALATYGRLHQQSLAGLLAGMFYVTNPMMFVTFGGEMPLQMAIIVWAFVAYRADRRMIAAALLACATLTRPDGILAAGVLGTYDLVTRRKLAWREGLLFAAIVAPFVALAWIAYGTPLPGPLGAKLAQRDSGLWPQSYGQGLRGWFRAYLLAEVDGPRIEFFSIEPGTLSFWTTIGVPALLLYRVWWLPLTWAAAFVIGYRTLKVPFYHWYAAPALVAVSIVMACGLAAVVSFARRGFEIWIARRRAASSSSATRTGRDLATVIIGALLVVIAGYPHLSTLQYTSREHPLITLYTEVGRWLRANTPPESSVGYYEIGFLGYYSQRRIVDAMGLIDPLVAPHVAERDLSWAYRHYRPTYIIARPEAAYVNGFLDEDWFKRDYRQRRVFTRERHELVLYEAVAPHGGP
jgi:hypothetical protein